MGLFGGGDAQLVLGVAMDVAGAHKGAEQLTKDIDNVDKSAESVGKSGGGLSGLLGNLGPLALGAGAGVVALGGFLVGAAKAAADEQVGIERLNGALKNNIPNWDGNSSAIDAYITKQQKLAFSDDEIRDSLGALVTQTHDLKEAQDLQATAMDLSRAKGIDLATASKLVGKVDMDNIGTLKKLGITIDEHASKEEALAAIRQATAGQAEAYANTAQGAMTRVQNALGDAMETIGGGVLSIVSGPLQAFADWITSPEITAGIQSIADFLSGALTTGFNMIGQAIAAVTPIVQPFIDAIVGFWSAIAGGGDIMASLGTYFTDLGGAIGNAWNIIAPALGDLVGNIVQWIVDNGPTILATLGQWAVAFGTWVVNDAIPALLGALGSLIQTVWTWIQENGPGILAQLGQWAQQFGAWIWNDALPALFSALGSLISQVWQWIQDNGPGILQQLGTWAQQFGAWIWNDALPALFSALGSLISQVWQWIQDNGPGILQQLGTWAQQFGAWIWNDAIPGLLKAAGDLIGTLIQWIADNGPGILAKLGEWAAQFQNWITQDVLPNIGSWLGDIAAKLWDWITTTAGDLLSKLVNEWIPAFWNWITGPGGVIANIGSKLGEIWNKITSWIGDTAKNIGTEVLKVGQGIVDGIKNGISNGWDAFVSWVQGLLSGLLDTVLNFFGIGGGGQAPTQAPGTGGHGGHGGHGAIIPGGLGSMAGNGTLTGGAGFAPIAGAGGPGVTLLLQIDGVLMSAAELSRRLNARVQLTTVRT